MRIETPQWPRLRRGSGHSSTPKLPTPRRSKSSRPRTPNPPPLSLRNSNRGPRANDVGPRKPSPYGIEPIKIFYFFIAVNLVSAAFAPIQDCDETFNYWEPTHYLSHGYGLQTWEYSPTYAIRSWLYVVFHAIPGNVRRLLPRPTKVHPLNPLPPSLLHPPKARIWRRFQR